MTMRRGTAGRYATPIEESFPGASPASAIRVGTLTQTARDLIEGAVLPLWVRGEVTDFKSHRNGHWYFCLRDETAQIRCVVWARDQRGFAASPDEGMQVVALGQLTVYAARGDLQLSVKAMDAQGDGLRRKQLAQIHQRLEADGLLSADRKRPLPLLPRRLAVITSPDGAVLHDIAAVVARRCPLVEVVVIPAKVQGDGAAEELCAALERLTRWGGADVVIIGRGGGARDDLWAFNDERLARALAACPIPTISAVGHEVDVTICDLVADLRAPTPSAAAEAAVPVLDDLASAVATLGASLRSAMDWKISDARERAGRAARDIATLATLDAERRRARLQELAGRLNALSPLATLARGYAVARASDGRTLSRTADFAPGDDFNLLLADGTIAAVARSIIPNTPST